MRLRKCLPSSLSDFAVSARSERVIGRLGLGQEALSEGNGSCGGGAVLPAQYDLRVADIEATTQRP